MTNLLPAAADRRTATPSPLVPRRPSARRLGVTAVATLVFAVGGGGGPLIAAADAQSSALQQSLGGSGVTQAQQPSTTRAAGSGGGGGGGGASSLNAAPDFSGPGISKAVGLIGWAKAGALVIGVLTLTIGIPASKALKEAGNHNASGIRAGVMSVGGATLLAGVAGTLLPWLMA